MRTSNGKKNMVPVIITILPLMAMLAAVLPGVVYNNADINTVKLGIILFLLSGITVFYIRFNADGILNKRLAKTTITLGYLISISLLQIIPEPEIFCFWMIGGLLISMLIDLRLGLIMNFNLCFLLGIMITEKPEDILRILAISILLCMLSGYVKKPSAVIYAAIIILSSDITISFAINNFSFDNQLNHDYLQSIFSLFIVLLTAFLLGLAYQALEKRAIIKYSNAVGELLEAYSQPSVTEEAVILKEKVEATAIFKPKLKNRSKKDTAILPDAQITHVIRTSYEVLCDPNNELLQKMKQHSGILYEHSLLIGDLSRKAALEIGANEMLAYAGGLYHDIGKLKGKNYIEEGLIIAEDYSFPGELKAIIKEHNIKFNKPSSLEAAIVMLSDSVVSTIDYIEKNDEHRYSTNKIIDNIFQMRMDKGTFDAISLSLRDFKKLKEFYQKEFNK